MWCPGPLAHTVWVLLAEVAEDGYAPNNTEAVVVDIRTMTRRRDWTLADGYALDRRLLDGHAARAKFRGSGRKLAEKEWRAVAGYVADYVDTVADHAASIDTRQGVLV